MDDTEMIDFLKSAANGSGDWMFPLVLQDTPLVRLVSEHPGFDEKSKAAFTEWSHLACENYVQVADQTHLRYALPEMEMLRVEVCLSIIHGLWQGAVCLTTLLLEAFLKLSLVYSNAGNSVEKDQPLSRLMSSLEGPVAKYMTMKLNDTINCTCKQGLIDPETKETLHRYRAQIRNCYFHADLKAMFGDLTTPVSGMDFGSHDGEGPNEVPIHAAPFLLGEAMWQTASVNAIPYFIEVDALIRETLPKVFPNLGDAPIEDAQKEVR